jgi:hypothetical protein
MALQYIAKVALTSVVFVGVFEIAKRSTIVGAVLASLPFFFILPALLNAGWGFWASMGVASGSAAIAYLAMTYCLSRMGMVG